MDMLWLAGLMGLLAACAFTFLWYMAFRRLRQRWAEDAGAASDAAADDVAQSDAGLLVASEHVDGTEFDPTIESDTNDDAFPDPMTLSEDYASGEDEEFDVHAFHTSAWDAFDEVDDVSEPVKVDSLADADDWIAAATAPEQFDEFDPQSDEFVVVWDDAAGQEPSVQVRRCDGDPALSDIVLDDIVVARFRSKTDVDADQLTLVPLSTARAIGWAHA